MTGVAHPIHEPKRWAGEQAILRVVFYNQAGF